jgi:hypothetical protein
MVAITYIGSSTIWIKNEIINNSQRPIVEIYSLFHKYCKKDGKSEKIRDGVTNFSLYVVFKKFKRNYYIMLL